MMRRAYIAVLILPTLLAMSILIARNAQAGDPADPPGGPCNNDERAELTVLSLYAAFAEGDTDTILKIIHPDVVWIESEGIPYGGTFLGRDAVFEGVFAKIADEWDDFTAEVDEIFSATGRRVVTVGEDSGTYRATGRSMVAPTVSFWTLNGHCQVVRFEQSIDTLQVRSAIDIQL
jgi:ketosteroid isomerase-like protein